MTTIAEILEQKGRAVHSIGPDQTVYEAVQKMVAANVGSLMVQEGAAVVGIVSERDYLRQIVLKDRTSKTTPVRDIMSSRVVAVAPDTTVDECMAIMTERRFRHLPVVAGGKVVGVVSMGDLVKSMSRSQQVHIQYLEDYISDRYPG
jgi:CBS domain-containing protein